MTCWRGWSSICSPPAALAAAGRAELEAVLEDLDALP
jgi:hypothetical protein